MADRQFPEQRNALVFVLGPWPADEVEPFAPLDQPFRISQLVLVPPGPRTDSRWERFNRPQPEETLSGNFRLELSIAKEVCTP
jgi:hypothetical protein